ncbi:hypothetical protein ACFE04_009730 [Oxalis oulophora]
MDYCLVVLVAFYLFLLRSFLGSEIGFLNQPNKIIQISASRLVWVVGLLQSLNIGYTFLVLWLTNILWGEAGESDDHIVPFQEETNQYHKKKEWSQEGTANKSTEQRTPEPRHDYPGSKSEATFKDGENSTYGFTPGSWPEFSSSSAAQNDPNVGTGELDKGGENFQNSLDDKEEGDFVDYSWANIGSFIDLDRILSNDDPVFGSGNLDNADELWSSSKDLANDFELGALRDDTSQNFNIKTEYEQSDDSPYVPNYEKAKHSTSEVEEYRGGKSKPTVKEKAYLTTGGKTTAFNSRVASEKAATPYQLAGGQKKPLKGRKKTQQNAETKSAQDFSSVWNPSAQYGKQLSPAMVQYSSSSILGQPSQLQAPGALQYQHIPSPYISYPYPMMPHVQPWEFNRPPVLSGYEVSPRPNPMSKSVSHNSTHGKTLTPQEKIEKLRRQQQMRALLAIQKQQQQFGHQENQIQNVEGSALTREDLSAQPSFDPNSPSEQDDFNTLSVAMDDYSAEESVLYRLQETISKLDVRVRLCIRDSLFRLAQSALQRNYAGEGSSPNKCGGNEQEVSEQKESDCGNRFPKLPDAETKTNAIDRIVAHLLFRRPLDSPGKNSDTPESSAHIKNPTEQEKENLMNNPNIDNSENTFNDGPEDGEAFECETSHQLYLGEMWKLKNFQQPGCSSFMCSGALHIHGVS